MANYSEDEVKNVLEQVTKKVIAHPAVSGTDYGLDDDNKQVVVRIFTATDVSHHDLGIASSINNVPVRIIKEGPFKPQ